MLYVGGKASFENAISLAIGSELFIHQRNELHGIVSDNNRKRAYCHVAETDTKEEPEKKKFKCYECGDPSHSFRRCPKYLNKRRNKFCDYCRITDHTFNECRKRLSQYQGQFEGNNTPHALNSNIGRQMDTMANPRVLPSRSVIIAATTPQDVKSPIVVFKSKDLANGVSRFLIDTGSELNIIKRGSLKKGICICRDNIYRLTGIGEGLIETHGYVQIELDGVQCRLNIVSDNFSIFKT